MAAPHGKGGARGREGRILVLSVFHGLGNRLRTVAAGQQLARELGRELHVHWPVNDSCLARWQDLFSAPALRINTPECHDGGRPPSGFWSEYEPQPGLGPGLGREDLQGLAADGAAVVRLRCAKCVASLVVSDTTEEDEKVARAHFYQQLRPSCAVRALMAPVMATTSERYMVGVHIRQGDAFDTEMKVFFRDHSGLYGEHADGGAVVDQFLDTMAKMPAAKGKGQAKAPVVFFLAADQVSARRRCAARFPGRILQIEPAVGRMKEMAVAEAAAAAAPVVVPSTERQRQQLQLPDGLARRDSLQAMQEAAAEWLLLSNCRCLIRSRVSSFSSEAALRHRISWVSIARSRAE
eukprot:COSAG01_NODE_7668_length_3106_cov_5.011307_2_plen_351_part_00